MTEYKKSVNDVADGPVKPLRFAPIIRVSTEKQRDQGESLKNQKTKIIAAVESLGGIIPVECWEYSGQEHATPLRERKKLDKLLRDSTKDIFDAVIVDDHSRWSRDNARGEDGLELLMNHKIRFFTGTTEHDLHDPTVRMTLAMHTVFNQFQAKMQSKKSRENRVHRFNRGIPCVGQVPFGRMKDPYTGILILDHDKQKMIEKAANQFLNGMTREKIAVDMGIKPCTLWRIFRDDLGDTWTTKLGTMKIPALLDEDTIHAVHQRLESNKTVTHGPLKHSYLLKGLIFCGDCGIRLSGVPDQRNKKGCQENMYFSYRHKKFERPCPNDVRWEIKAEVIEDAVMATLYGMLGNKEKIEAALAAAIPEADKKEEMRAEIVRYQEELKRLETRKSKLIDAVADGFLSGSDIKIKMDEINGKEAEIKAEITIRMSAIENIRSKKELGIYAKMIADARNTIAEHRSMEDYLNMPFAKKRRMLESILMGKDDMGKQFGIYINSEKKGYSRTFSYTINADAIGIVKGTIPMNEWEQLDHIDGTINRSSSQ